MIAKQDHDVCMHVEKLGMCCGLANSRPLTFVFICIRDRDRQGEMEGGTMKKRKKRVERERGGGRGKETTMAATKSTVRCTKCRGSQAVWRHLYLTLCMYHIRWVLPVPFHY